MKPTVGRIVMYVLSENDQLTHECGTNVLPAMIVKVWSDTCVNLKVFNNGPNDFWRTSVVENTGSAVSADKKEEDVNGIGAIVDCVYYPSYSWHWPVIAK